MKAFRPCKVRVNGRVYTVDANRIVTDLEGAHPCADICDAETSAMVLKEVARLRANKARRARHQAYTDCGLVRVKGNLGGTYYE